MRLYVVVRETFRVKVVLYVIVVLSEWGLLTVSDKDFCCDFLSALVKLLVTGSDSATDVE